MDKMYNNKRKVWVKGNLMADEFENWWKGRWEFSNAAVDQLWQRTVPSSQRRETYYLISKVLEEKALKPTDYNNNNDTKSNNNNDNNKILPKCMAETYWSGHLIVWLLPNNCWRWTAIMDAMLGWEMEDGQRKSWIWCQSFSDVGSRFEFSSVDAVHLIWRYASFSSVRLLRADPLYKDWIPSICQLVQSLPSRPELQRSM